MIRTVIFDVDDTLYSFHHANEVAVDGLADYVKVHFGWSKENFLERQKAAMADIRQYAGTSGGYRSRILRYQNILEAAGLPVSPHAMAMSSIYQNLLLDNMIPEPGIAAFLQYLKDHHFRIGIGSDATAQQQFLKLDRLGFLPFFEFIVTSEEVGVEKPDPRFFKRCHQKCACNPNEVMFIGDNFEKDYIGAKNAGYYAVWYNPKRRNNEIPVTELYHFAEASELLDKINNNFSREEDEE